MWYHRAVFVCRVQFVRKTVCLQVLHGRDHACPSLLARYLRYVAKIERGKVFPEQPYPSQYDAAAGKSGASAGAYILRIRPTATAAAAATSSGYVQRHHAQRRADGTVGSWGRVWPWVSRTPSGGGSRYGLPHAASRRFFVFFGVRQRRRVLIGLFIWPWGGIRCLWFQLLSLRYV